MLHCGQALSLDVIAPAFAGAFAFAAAWPMTSRLTPDAAAPPTAPMLLKKPRLLSSMPSPEEASEKYWYIYREAVDLSF